MGINWDAINAIGTISLVLVSIPLAIYAGLQFFGMVKYNRKNEVHNQKQLAEDRIVKLVEFHYKILERIENVDKHEFRRLYENLRANFGFTIKKTKVEAENQIFMAYDILNTEKGERFSHYFRNLYRVLESIDDIKIEEFDKKYYTKLVLAQLSEYEMLLLFYHCIWVNDDTKFKKLIEKYELMDSVNLNKLIDRTVHLGLYNTKAFGKI